MRAVIVGAGHAGGQLVHSLRMHGWSGQITLIGEEARLPYQRPPLSKQLLAGDADPDDTLLYGAEFYRQADVDVITDRHVTAIDRDCTQVELANGATIAYDYLALTVGSRPRRLELPGSDLDNIHYIRDLDQALALRKRFRGARRLVVVGGGYIGLEVAAAAAKANLDVTVVELADRVMNRVVAPVISQYFESLHSANGVHVRTSTGVRGFTGTNGAVCAVQTEQGELGCDLVVVGVGIAPQTKLAEDCGLTVNDGIEVDAYARTTTDARIFAAGDCTRHPNSVYGRDLRLECIQNASDQATIAARSMCDDWTPYQAIPWFWSQQYDTKLQIAGMSQGHEQVVVRGQPESGEFAAYYLRDEQLIAVDAVNSPRDYMMAKRLIARGARPAAERIADLAVPVKALAD